MKRLLSMMMMAVLVTAMMVGCGAKDKKTMTIGLAADQLFESRVPELDGIKAEAEANGYKVIEVVADGDAQNQNAQIQSLINQNVDALIVCAVDQNTVETALMAAKNAEIPVVAFDRALPDSQSVDAFVGLGSFADGLAAGNYMVELLKNETGDVAVLELLGALNDQNGIDRSAGFQKAFEALPNVEIISMPTDWSSDKALAATQNSFQANPNIKAIYAATDTQIPSIETVLTDIGKLKLVGEEGHIVITGINGSFDGYDTCVRGVADAIVVADMYSIGVESAKAALALINGETVEKSVYVPGILYTSANIEANKATIWGVK